MSDLVVFGDSRVPSRIWGKIREGECWIWTGYLNQDGYGRIQVGSAKKMVHRLLWEIFYGTVPPGMELDHLCRTRSCVNPSHLDVVTHAENVRRGRGGENWSLKTHCPQGHPYDEKNTRLYRGSRHCRACSTERARRYRLADPERHREQLRRSRAKRKARE